MNREEKRGLYERKRKKKFDYLKHTNQMQKYLHRKEPKKIAEAIITTEPIKVIKPNWATKIWRLIKQK
jgi:hypothetical protein